MKKLILIAAVLLTGLGASAALADDDCDVPMANWQPREAVQKVAQEQGWTVRRIKIDDGCYEIKGIDKDGRRIEVKLDPATLKVVELDYDDDHGDRHDRRKRQGEHQRQNGVRTDQPAGGASTPPNNGLFNNGASPKVQVQ